MARSFWSRALVGLAVAQAVAQAATPTLRGLQATNGTASTTTTVATCPAADSPLARATTPALTTLCPSSCVSGGVCVYFPKGFESHCQVNSDQACLYGDSCAFECFPGTGPGSLGWYLTLYNDPSLMGDFVEINYDSMSRNKAQYRAVMINATLVNQWVGPLEFPNTGELVISGNEAANSVLRTDDEMNRDEYFHVPGTGIVPFDFPASFFEGSMRSYTWLRLENLRLPNVSNVTPKLEFPVLERLWLRNTMLTAFPLANASFPVLQDLDLSANAISQIVPSMIPESVSFANFSWNAISNVAKNALPSNLSALDLRLNPIKAIPNGTLPLGIERLWLMNDQLTAVPADVAGMTGLSELYLDENDLGEIPDMAIPPSVETLSVENCSLIALPKALKSLTQLKVLFFDRNDLSRDPDFSVLPASIEDIWMDNCQLQKLPAELQTLPKLQSLDLSGNPKVMADLSRLPKQLIALFLRNNSLEAVPAAVKDIIVDQFVLDDNPLEKIVPGSIPDSIYHITMTNAKFRILPSGTLPAKLNYFSIENCALEEVPEDLRTREELLGVNIGDCQLKSFDVGDTMTKVDTILLDNNRLASFSGNFPSLLRLVLNDNELASFSNVNATALEWLDLSRNNLSTFPVPVFDMSSLIVLNLTGNPIRDFKPTEDQVAFLQGLDTVLMGQSMFAGDCEASTRVSVGEYTVCVQQEVVKPPAASKSWKWLVPLNIVLAILLALFIYMFWRRRKLQKQRSQDLAIEQANLEKQQQDQGNVSIWADAVLLRDRIDEDLITRVRLLGAGMFGEVWLATYKNEKVALKQLKQAGGVGGVVDSQAINDFVQEIKLLQSLAHPSVVQFVGVMWTKESDIAMVTEYMDGGDLRSYLDQHPKIYAGWTTQMVRIALQVTDAIVYLHTLDPIVIHRDLKSRNVLLDTAMRAKLSDFGVSRYKMDDDTMTAGVGTVRWVAPEVLAGQRYTESVDVYSLGVIFSEMDTHKLPFEGLADEGGGEPLSDSAIAGMVVTGALRVGVSKSCPSEIRSLVERCTAFDPASRPRALDIADELRAMLEGSSASTGTSSGTSSGIFRSVGSSEGKATTKRAV